MGRRPVIILGIDSYNPVVADQLKTEVQVFEPGRQVHYRYCGRQSEASFHSPFAQGFLA